MDPKSTAVVLIEYQNDFTSDGGTLHQAVKPVMDKTNMPANTVETVKQARALGATIVYAPITFTDDYHELSPSPYGILKGVVDSKSFRQGTWGAQIVGVLKPTDQRAPGGECAARAGPSAARLQPAELWEPPVQPSRASRASATSNVWGLTGESPASANRHPVGATPIENLGTAIMRRLAPSLVHSIRTHVPMHTASEKTITQRRSAHLL